MPEMLMRYKPTAGKTPDAARQRAMEMVAVVKDLAQEVFGKEVVWECKPFGDTEGMPDFYANVWVTDNDDVLIQTALDVQGKCLELMSQLAYENEAVECWVQRVKGKWGRLRGKKPV